MAEACLLTTTVIRVLESILLLASCCNASGASAFISSLPSVWSQGWQLSAAEYKSCSPEDDELLPNSC